MVSSKISISPLTGSSSSRLIMSSTAAASAPAPTPGQSDGGLIKPTTTLLTEVPSSLKQLARLVVRGFYSIEDSLVIDMLVRYPCMREEDLSELLKFDRKFLRARMAGLVKDKLVHMKQRIETTDAGGEGSNAKVTRMNCYFINYKIFVNIVKYKLDLMHKKMETSERDATTRSNFRCSNCSKTFTDLEANQLFDPQTMEFR